ncbi:MULTISPECIES: hypothetical protein [Kocuria]|uniref:Uncharacterized protein n=2 Tax=Kocuria salsicia TaxID=664639 RepID=A0ABV3KCU4_9MICC|nr:MULTISPECIES: hypothetical protein [Kocuria]
MAQSSARPSRRRSTPARGTSRMTRAEAARARADHDNAWRQWISDSAVETVDTALSHVQAVVEEQVTAYGTFPAFLVTGGKDGEFELNSVDPQEAAGMRPEQILDSLRAIAREKAPSILVGALAYPATLPDRSGAAAVIAEVEHRERLSLEVVQEYKVVSAKGRTFVNFEDPHTDRADPWLFGVRD